MNITKSKIFDYIIIAFGAFLIAFAVSVFLVPGKITSGGISAVGTVMLYFFNVPISVTNILLNSALFALGYRELGRKSLYKTVFGIIALTLFFEVCARIPAYTGDMLAASLAGGIIMGLGLGLAVRVDGSTGGSDFAGIMIHKRTSHISVANIILFIDLCIIVLSGIAFGSITVTIYSALTLFVATKVCDMVLSFGNAAKEIQILSDKSDDIAATILTKFNRGVTGVHCKGMYTKNNSLMLYCIVSPRELPKILDIVRRIDSEAFIAVSDVREVLGRGFKE